MVLLRIVPIASDFTSLRQLSGFARSYFSYRSRGFLVCGPSPNKSVQDEFTVSGVCKNSVRFLKSYTVQLRFRNHCESVQNHRTHGSYSHPPTI